MYSFKKVHPLTSYNRLFIPGLYRKINFDTERSANQLVVDGGITDHPGPYELRLGMTSKTSTVPVPLTGASVAIVDGDGNREAYVEGEDGLYLLMGKNVRGKGVRVIASNWNSPAAPGTGPYPKPCR